MTGGGSRRLSVQPSNSSCTRSAPLPPALTGCDFGPWKQRNTRRVGLRRCEAEKSSGDLRARTNTMRSLRRARPHAACAHSHIQRPPTDRQPAAEAHACTQAGATVSAASKRRETTAAVATRPGGARAAAPGAHLSANMKKLAALRAHRRGVSRQAQHCVPRARIHTHTQGKKRLQMLGQELLREPAETLPSNAWCLGLGQSD